MELVDADAGTLAGVSGESLRESCSGCSSFPSEAGSKASGREGRWRGAGDLRRGRGEISTEKSEALRQEAGGEGLSRGGIPEWRSSPLCTLRRPGIKTRPSGDIDNEPGAKVLREMSGAESVLRSDSNSAQEWVAWCLCLPCCCSLVPGKSLLIFFF